MFFFGFKNWLNEILLQFSSKQTKALIFIIILIASIVYINHNANKLFYKTVVADTNFIRQYEEFIKQLEPKKQETYLNRLDKYILKRYDTIELFPFDPNVASKETLLKLGLTEKQVNNILLYRERGGRFYTKEDFRKLYGLRYMQYKILSPYLLLPESLPNKKRNFKKNKEKLSSPNYTLFYFNPNTISLDSLILLGFTKAQAQSIIKAREKGWRFRIKKDFSKLYIVNDKKYSELEPYILLPDSLSYSKKNKNTKIEKIELNSADAETLEKTLSLKPWIAKRIVKYRNALGGFYKKSQITEVYGFPQQKYRQIRKYIYVDTNLINKIHLLTCSYEELVRHPYIDKDFASWIIKRRKKNKLNNLDDLKKYKNMDEYELRILLHYLKF